MDFSAKTWAKYRRTTIYGLSLALLLFLLKFLELNYLVMRHSFEVYAGLIAVVFTVLGIWLAVTLIRPKVLVVESPAAAQAFRLNDMAVEKLGISPRELEVLQLMAEGLSNRQIGERLFVSESTVKTHAASLNVKLHAERRTQAVEKAKRLGLIP